jgi:type IV fimbrial biogenesis protein FimT
VNQDTNVMPATDQPRTRGFTLIELMIAIIVVAILAGFAVPSMNRLMLKHRAQDAATGLFTTLFKARSEALRRVQVVTLQPNTTGSDWTTGWKIVDNATNILDTQVPTKNLTLTTTPTSLTKISYNATGHATCTPACTTGPVFVFSATNGNYSCTYTVSIDPTGRPYETSNRESGTAAATGGGAPSC